jgi:hypothetical protein
MVRLPGEMVRLFIAASLKYTGIGFHPTTADLTAKRYIGISGYENYWK